MPMTDEQRDNWFTYHQPTDETAPRYAAIRAAEARAVETITMALDEGRGAAYDLINDACRTFALVIDEQAPDSADKSAAIRCVRLARNAANEMRALSMQTGHFDMELDQYMREQLRAARWQANSAIACNGK